MAKNLQGEWPEIVFGSSDTAVSQRIRRAIQAGQLRKLAPRIYSSNLTDAPEAIILRNLYPILGVLFSGAVLSHRSALAAGPTKLPHTTDQLIILTYRYTRQVTLPGIMIRLVIGPEAQEGDTPFMGKLFIASRARALLENMQQGRGPSAKSLPNEAIEKHLDKLCQHYGVEELNTIRDQARGLADTLDMHKEFEKLDKVIGALLGTQSDYRLRTTSGKARSQGLAYDVHRIALFASLATALSSSMLARRIDKIDTADALENIAFFEAYFSNYIEGTTFTIEEASDIIFQHKTIPNRSADSHDILSTYQIVSNMFQMGEVVDSSEAWIMLLKKRHAAIMAMRPDKDPGQFKHLVNRVGRTVFVKPELVLGTLHKAFDVYQSVPIGLSRAMLVMFIVSEIHPFLDGNGRIARIMMNAELVHAGEGRIIIPTVYREDYLLAIRRLTNAGDPKAYIKMLTTAQAFTASIDFHDFDKALKQLHKGNAFLEPHEGKLIF